MNSGAGATRPDVFEDPKEDKKITGLEYSDLLPLIVQSTSQPAPSSNAFAPIPASSIEFNDPDNIPEMPDLTEE